MIKHVVVAAVQPDTDHAELDELIAEWRLLEHHIPEVRSLTVGRNLGLLNQRYSVAAVAEFASPEDWRRFTDHPRHVAFGQHCARVLDRDRLAIVQFETSDQ